MEDFIVSAAASVLLRIIQDPDKASKWRRLLVKIFKQIGASLINDPEVQTAGKLIGRG